MAEENRPMKYMRYAIGEIFLVVVGILIALQINNWNEERIQKKELDGLLQSIANGVQADVRELKLLAVARANIVVKADSIFKTYIPSDIKSVSLTEASYINSALQDVSNKVHFNANVSAFESLKNSTYIGKIQGTDLAILLSAYYSAAENLRNLENQYNQRLENLDQDWMANFRNNGETIFTRYWTYDNFDSVVPRYLEILRDDHTTEILGSAISEGNSLQTYREQILMGNKLVEMIRNSETEFDEQTKVEFSGILFSFADADLVNILSNGDVPTGFDIKYSASSLFGNYFSKEKDYLVMAYPENTFEWGSPYFWVNALQGRVNEMDFSTYTKVVLEMKGEMGGEVFQIAMKDKSDPNDGSESRVSLELTSEWKVYEIETSQFATADMKTIMIPLAFIFTGPTGRKIHVRSIQFKKG